MHSETKKVRYLIVISLVFERSYGLMLNNETSIGIYRYFHLNREKDIFSNLTQLEYDSADEYLAYIKEHNLAVKSYNEHYLRRRFNTEKALYEQFVRKGGKPRRNQLPCQNDSHRGTEHNQNLTHGKSCH